MKLEGKKEKINKSREKILKQEISLIYDIIPPEKIKKIAKEVVGVKKYKSIQDKVFAFSWRLALTTFLTVCLLTGFAPIKFINKSITALSQETEQEKISLYAQNCTGNWQNIDNVLGKPEVGSNGDLNYFSATNSAVYTGGNFYLICQDFEKENTTTEKISTTTS
jgi:hypothetical protein